MDKNYNGSQMSMDIVRQLNQGLFQIQTELDDIKAQMQNERERNFAQKRNATINCDKADNSRDSARDNSTLISISNRIDFLANEIKEIKSSNGCDATSLVKSVKDEVTCCFEKMTDTVKSFDGMLAEVKKSIVEKVEADFAQIIGKEFFGEKGRLDKLATDVAEGVEKKIELKFTEMFLELDKLTKEATTESMDFKMKKANVEGFSYNFGGKILDKLDLFASRLDAFEKILGASADGVFLGNEKNENENGLENKVEYLTYLLENKLSNANVDQKESEEDSKDNAVEFAEIKLRINEVVKLINSKKEIELRPVYEVLNELDEKLADVKFGVNETMSKLTSIDSGKFVAKNDNVQSVLSEIPKLVKEGVANGLSNVNDEEIKVAFEKFNNQLNTIYIKNEERYDEIVKMVEELKNSLENADNSDKNLTDDFKDGEMEETLSSLRGELTNLSKLIKETEFDKAEETDTAIPKAIKDATDELDNLTKEIFTDKKED